MNPAYAPWLGTAGANFDGETLLSFGNPQQELSAGESGSVIVPLVHLGLIRVTGEDAAVFLHNLFSNDVKGLTADTARLNSFCTAKGRMLASFLTWREAGGDVLLQPAADVTAGIQKKLSMYVLRSKAKLSDASGRDLSVRPRRPAGDDRPAGARTAGTRRCTRGGPCRRGHGNPARRVAPDPGGAGDRRAPSTSRHWLRRASCRPAPVSGSRSISARAGR